MLLKESILWILKEELGPLTVRKAVLPGTSRNQLPHCPKMGGNIYPIKKHIQKIDA